MTTQQWMVVLTCDEPVGPRWKDFAGTNRFGPMTGPEAEAHRDALNSEFMRLLEAHGPAAFVYGPPKVEIEILWPADNPRGAARNWVHVQDEDPMPV